MGDCVPLPFQAILLPDKNFRPQLTQVDEISRAIETLMTYLYPWPQARDPTKVYWHRLLTGIAKQALGCLFGRGQSSSH
jgi:hypothetical protein